MTGRTSTLENATRGKEPVGFAVIGAMKIASGFLLLAAGFGIFRLLDSDLGDMLQRWASRLHLDPENRLVHNVVYRIGGLDRRQLKAIGAGTFFYAFLHFVEGTGLILRRRWAGYLTAVITGSLLPLELYELARRTTKLRLLVLAVNLIVLFYIVVKLAQERHADAKDADLGPDRHDR